ncbi:hypothetical protein SAMN05421812_104339 [Asanoa hainanensis]|uniref:Uncharacterized protein n=1 Tax=Asanoa hainanensis TaxID=560556 RepID=A0A239LI21_9ACTN|nr:hypothetical protein [Asanoa hainanensis]SNT29950.1 hypothetical protein SAMN05421812_104339 [Asanoa hainanensis]
MTTPNVPEERTIVDDLAQVHAALRVHSLFFEEHGLADLTADERQSVREDLEFIIGRAIVQNCDDSQLEKLEQKVRSNGTLEALRWLYSATPHTFRDAVHAGLFQLVDKLRSRYSSPLAPGRAAMMTRQRAGDGVRSRREYGTR